MLLLGLALPLTLDTSGRAAGADGYSYAGLSSGNSVGGIAATLTYTQRAHVRSGHVAAWVGVGGPGLGPGGIDEWIQIGVDGFPGAAGKVYMEVKRGQVLRFRELPRPVAVGDRRRLAVFELASRRGWWQATVDGKPAGPPTFLPGSDGAWRAQVMTESLSEGRARCNTFSFSFADVAVRRPGSLEPTAHAPMQPFVQGGIRLSRSATGFRSWGRC